MKAIHLLAPATLAISAALNPATAAEPLRTVAPAPTSEEGRRTSNARRAILLRTEFVNFTRERRLLGCDDCGNLFSYYVTVFTLRDVFSDGSAKTRFHTVGA